MANQPPPRTVRSIAQLCHQYRMYVRQYNTWSLLWRLFVIGLMTMLWVVGMWSGILTQSGVALAASTQTASPALPSTAVRHDIYASSISACPSLTDTPKVVGNPDGLGTLGFYTFVKQNLDDRLLLETNVANGNVVAQYTADQIHGTGLDLDIQFTYNAQSTSAGVLGANWNLSVGNGVSLSFNGSNVTLHGSSGFSAQYTADSSSYGGYDEPAGLDATLLKSTVNGATYVLIFQKTSECFGFNASGQEIFDQDKNGHQITFSYNGSGNISGLTDTQGRATSFSYDGSGRINKITDPISRTVQLGYDSNNNLNSLIDLNSKTTSFGYGSNHLLTSVTDPDSHVTNIFYQSGGNRLDHITDALNHTTYYAYYSSGASQCTSQIPTLPCTVVTDANSHTTIYGYSGQEVQDVVDGNGNMEQKSYTPDANVSQYTDPLLDKTVFNFDVGNTNNLLSITDGNKATTTLGYTNTNPYLPTTFTDAQNNEMSYGYDSNGNLTSATDISYGGTGTSTSYTYNTSVAYGSFLYGTLTKTTDGDGNSTSYDYDSVGNLKTVTPPSPLGSEAITVDGASRVTKVVDGNGVAVAFIYDNMDRLKKITYNGGSAISYLYNGDGDQTSESDNTGTTSFSYDKDNRLLTKTLPNSAQLTVSYDPVGNIQTYTDSGGTVTYDYDNANRVIKVVEPDSSVTVYGYNTANEKTSISYPNGTGELFTYDKAGHVTSAIGGIMSQGQITTAYLNFTYNYFIGQTPTQLLQTVKLLDPIGHSNTYNRLYSYDSMNRLLYAYVTNSSNQEVQDWVYTYDTAGNRLTSWEYSTGQTTNYTYNAAEELTKTVQGSTTVTYNYDGNGNLTSSSDGNSFSYNVKNQTTAINSNSYTYSGPDQTERVTLNSTTDAYSGLGLSYETTGSSTTYYTRCSCGLLVNERLSGGKDYYLFDGLGSIVGLTNSSGGEDNAYDYDPYGNIFNEFALVVNPWQYAGGYFDSSTGLVKFGTRYYNPALGRWTQQDPVGGSLGNPDTLNRYLYAKDNPVSVVDPSGRNAIDCIATILVAVGGALGQSLLWAAPIDAALSATGPGAIIAVIVESLAAIAINWGTLWLATQSPACVGIFY